MPEMLSPEDALTRYVEAPLDSLRADHVMAWAAGFGHDGLAQGILANPRFETRITADICQSFGQSRLAEPPKASQKPVLIALGQHGAERLADLVGCALNARAVLGWITWGHYGEHMPDLPADQVRAMLQRIDPRLLEDKANAAATELTAERIRADGEAALGAWRAELPQQMRARLGLFYDNWLSLPNEGAADLVVAVSQALQEDAA